MSKVIKENIIIYAIVLILLLVAIIYGVNHSPLTEEAESTTNLSAETSVVQQTEEPTVKQTDSGQWAACRGETIDYSFTGIASNDLGSWYIQNGFVDFSFTGPVTYNNNVYNIVDGKVQ